jgi:hypothetical protein
LESPHQFFGTPAQLGGILPASLPFRTANGVFDLGQLTLPLLHTLRASAAIHLPHGHLVKLIRLAA